MGIEPIYKSVAITRNDNGVIDKCDYTYTPQQGENNGKEQTSSYSRQDEKGFAQQTGAGPLEDKQEFYADLARNIAKYPTITINGETVNRDQAKFAVLNMANQDAIDITGVPGFENIAKAMGSSTLYAAVLTTTVWADKKVSVEEAKMLSDIAADGVVDAKEIKQLNQHLNDFSNSNKQQR